MQKKPSSQEFADRELWRYPVQIAELLLGTSEPQRIIDSVTEFAKTYNYTRFQIEHIPGIVKRVWLGHRGRGPGRFLRSFTRHIGGLAAESVGASVNWYHAHGYIPAQAVYLWTVDLCCGTGHEEGSGVCDSVAGLSDWVLHGVSSPETLTVVERMCESLFAFVDWDDAMRLLWLLACIRVAVADENPVVEPFDAKIATQEDCVGMGYALIGRWDVDTGQLLSDWECREWSHIGRPGEDTEGLRRKHAEASTLLQNMLARYVGKYIGEPQE